MPFYIKLYTFSIVFEPLLFFIIGDQSYTGVALNIGRVLQIFSIILIFLNRLKIKNSSILNYKYFYFFVYFFLSIIALFIGFSQGVFHHLPKYDDNYASGFFARLIKSDIFRPFFEYFILLYNFTYFVLLPQYIYKNKTAISYFYFVFKHTFVICLSIGFLDLLIQLTTGLELLPRDMSEGRTVGFRFHGIAGEPRDAFVYLIYSLGILLFSDYLIHNKLVSKSLVYITILAALLTQSVSGLFGIFIGFTLFSLSLVKKISINKLVLIFSIFIFFATVVYFSFLSSDRIQDYVKVFDNFYQILESGDEIPPLIAPQMVNIYPIWDLYKHLINGNVFPLFFGNGFGSASAINLKLGNGFWGSLSNPHSQLIRLLYESGLIGTVFFILSFVFPIKKILHNRIEISKNLKQYFIFFTFLIIGLNLGQRSTTIYIYLGLFIAHFNLFHKNINYES